jgi:hypothetical protein
MEDLIGRRRRTLYETLLEKMPDRYQSQYTEDTLNITALARDLKMSREGVYKWFRANRISPRGATAICKLSRGRIVRDDLIPFVF